jgi:hypothetical protein
MGIRLLALETERIKKPASGKFQGRMPPASERAEMQGDWQSASRAALREAVWASRLPRRPIRRMSAAMRQAGPNARPLVFEPRAASARPINHRSERIAP